MELWRSCRPAFGIFASGTAASDRPINVLYVGVRAAQLAARVRPPPLLQSAVTARAFTTSWPAGHAELFDLFGQQRRSPLHRQGCDRIPAVVAVLDVPAAQ